MEPMKNSPHSSKPGEDDGGAAAAAPPASNEAAAGDDARAKCSLCGRTFASMKAMFGHLRCHPERERRLITLRTTHAAEKPCNQIHGSSSVASPCGGSWSKKAKRGSKGMVASSNNPVHSPDSKNSAATMDGDHTVLDIDSASGQPEVKRATLLLDIAEGGKGEAASKGETNSEVSASATGAGSSEDTASDPHCGHKDGDGLGGRACDHRSCNEWCFSSSQRKRRREDSEAETGSRSGYACTASGKSLSSSRALGGHMASHGKLSGKDSTMGSGSDDGVGSAGAAGISKSTQRLRPEAIPVEHKCNVCGKTYPTGQALGGHKRLHYEGLKRPRPPPPPPPPVGGAAAPSSRGLQSSSRRLRDFDLNELPRQEDGERSSGWH